MPEISIEEAVAQILEAVTADQVFPDPAYLSYYQLLKERIIYLDPIVDIDGLLIQKQLLMWNAEDKDVPPAERKPIKLIIMSYGGNIDCMWMLIDAIQMSVTPVYTYNIGVAHSAAGMIFMAGEKRYMTQNARLMIHEGSAEFKGDAGKILDASNDYKKILKRSSDYIIERTNIPKSTLSRKRSNDWELGAEECLKYNVCNYIITSFADVF